MPDQLAPVRSLPPPGGILNPHPCCTVDCTGMAFFDRAMCPACIEAQILSNGNIAHHQSVAFDIAKIAQDHGWHKNSDEVDRFGVTGH